MKPLLSIDYKIHNGSIVSIDWNNNQWEYTLNLLGKKTIVPEYLMDLHINPPQLENFDNLNSYFQAINDYKSLISNIQALKVSIQKEEAFKDLKEMYNVFFFLLDKEKDLTYDVVPNRTALLFTVKRKGKEIAFFIRKDRNWVFEKPLTKVLEDIKQFLYD